MEQELEEQRRMVEEHQSALTQLTGMMKEMLVQVKDLKDASGNAQASRAAGGGASTSQGYDSSGHAMACQPQHVGVAGPQTSRERPLQPKDLWEELASGSEDEDEDQNLPEGTDVAAMLKLSRKEAEEVHQPQEKRFIKWLLAQDDARFRGLMVARYVATKSRETLGDQGTRELFARSTLDQAADKLIEAQARSEYRRRLYTNKLVGLNKRVVAAPVTSPVADNQRICWYCHRGGHSEKECRVKRSDLQAGLIPAEFAYKGYPGGRPANLPSQGSSSSPGANVSAARGVNV